MPSGSMRKSAGIPRCASRNPTAPPGVVHYFRNVSDEPARMLNLHTPGGFAEYRRQLAAFREQGVEPDEAFFERHDVFDVD